MSAYNDNDNGYADTAMFILIAGLFVIVGGVIVCFNSGPPQTTAKTCLFLGAVLEVVAAVVGILGRHNFWGKIAIAGGIILASLSAWMLFLLVQLLRNPPGI